jgi:hypothetical protein
MLFVAGRGTLNGARATGFLACATRATRTLLVSVALTLCDRFTTRKHGPKCGGIGPNDRNIRSRSKSGK